MENPDIVALFDTGANQLFGGNRDFVRYLTNSKQMFSYYGPKQNLGIGGMALLSRFRLTNAQTVFAQHEEMAVIKAKVQLNATMSFVVHVSKDCNKAADFIPTDAGVLLSQTDDNTSTKIDDSGTLLQGGYLFGVSKETTCKLMHENAKCGDTYPTCSVLQCNLQ